MALTASITANVGVGFPLSIKLATILNKGKIRMEMNEKLDKELFSLITVAGNYLKNAADIILENELDYFLTVCLAEAIEGIRKFSARMAHLTNENENDPSSPLSS